MVNKDARFVLNILPELGKKPCLIILTLTSLSIFYNLINKPTFTLKVIRVYNNILHSAFKQDGFAA